jgi:hypothetical protein
LTVVPRLLALAWLAYFASGDRVLSQLAAARAGQPPLHVEAALSTAASDAPGRLRIDLHPDFGMRVSDDRGGRWIVQRGRVVAGTTVPAPSWLPDLEILVLRQESALREWLGSAGVDVSANELARCGEGDCYVLGTRKSLAQLWVDKNALVVRRLVLPGRAPLELEEWRAFDKIQFPARIELSGDGATATLAVDRVAPELSLAASDFSPAWVQASPAGPAR